MFLSFWSVKGGSGTTVVAVAKALELARSEPDGVLLVDLAGDAAAVLGCPEPDGPGISEWLSRGPSVPPDGLARLERPVATGLTTIGWGHTPVGPAEVERAQVLAALLAADVRPVLVDCGLVHDDGSPPDDIRAVFACAATHSWLVTRSCYLSLRRATRAAHRPSGVVLVREPGRALDATDIEHILEVPVVCEVEWDPAIARAVDGGLLARRLPRALGHAVRRVA